MDSSSVTSYTTAEVFSESGMPRVCYCGRDVVVRVSRTPANPGRLFFTCPDSRRNDNNHLFKWVDDSLVEHVQLMTNTVDELKAQMLRVDEARNREREAGILMLREARNLKVNMDNGQKTLEETARNIKRVKMKNFILGFMAGVVLCSVLGCNFKRK